jgi:hypothetical protein
MSYICLTLIAMKDTDVPDTITIRPNDERKKLISWLSNRLNPKNMSDLIWKGLEALKEQGQPKQ